MNRITLTFDNGPTPGVTDKVLDVLAREGVRSTFFVVGNRLMEPGSLELARAAHAAGHWIGNHTFSHDVPLGRRGGCDIAAAEIGRTQALIGDLGHEMKLFRPFGGGGAIGKHLLDRPCLQYLKDGAFTCVLWNAIPGDWKDPDGWVDRALAQCEALDWALVVLHDLPTGAMDHLGAFIARARDRGARFMQDFPPDCVPMVRGVELQTMATFVADKAA